MSLNELNELSMEEFYKMAQAIDIIKAQDTLTYFKVSAFPHLKKEDRESIHRHYHKVANPSVWDGPKKLSLREIAQALGGR